ncbi:MAG: hypothetical protein LBL98_05155 [Ruminococcus sp.]|nr:hypothetical protein [Ruminococcus sp.]
MIETRTNPLFDIDTNFYHYVSARSKAHALKSDSHLIGGKLDYAFDGDTDYRQKLGGMFGMTKVLKPVFPYIAETYRMAFGSSAKAGSLKFAAVYEISVKCAERLNMVLPMVFVLATSNNIIYSLEGENIAEACIVISSGLAECGDEKLLKFLIGRECGRIQNAHCLYKSAASFYGLTGTDSDRRETLTDTNIKTALSGWYRLSDITCDRAGIISLDDPSDYLKVALRAISIGLTGIYKPENLTEDSVIDGYEKIHFTPARSISLDSSCSDLYRRLCCGLEFINCEVLYNRRTDAHPTVSHLVNKQAMEVRCVIISEGGVK